MKEVPIIPDQRKDDLHNLHLLDKADFILFLAGNQFMLAKELITNFQKKYPEIKNIFYETLPPKLELQQILANGAKFQNKIIPGNPDVYTSVSIENMQILEKENLIFKDYFIYAHNKLSLMVPKGNPKKIKSVYDLARTDIIISQPNPEIEDIAQYTINMYHQAGGRNLVKTIMKEKVKEGKTIFTTVHHRETPNKILKGEVDVGPVWHTEILNAQQQGLEIEGVEIPSPLNQETEVNYYACLLKKAKNIENGKRFLTFLKSDVAKNIYTKYGFIPE